MRYRIDSGIHILRHSSIWQLHRRWQCELRRRASSPGRARYKHQANLEQNRIDLNPFRVKTDLHEDADLSGPILFIMAFGLFQSLAGKLHFGIVFGLTTVASLFLYVVFNMLAGRNGNLDLYRCLSLIGYCMLPILMLSALSLFVPQGGLLIFGGFS